MNKQVIKNIIQHRYPANIGSRNGGKDKMFLNYDRDSIKSSMEQHLLSNLNSKDLVEMDRDLDSVMLVSLYGICSNAEIIRELNLLMKSVIGIAFDEFNHSSRYQKYILSLMDYKIVQLGLKSVQEYRKYLNKDEDERNYFIGAVSPSTTYFFREDFEEEFDLIQKEYSLDGDQKVLFIGCSSGAEVYSFSYVWEKKRLNYSIIATDINKFALEFAERAEYPIEIVDQCKEEVKEDLFDGKHIAEKYKQKVVFRQLDISKNFELGKFDMVIVRNTIKYFDEDDRKSIFERILKNLKPKGLIVVGIQSGSNKDVDPKRYIACTKVGSYSYMVE